MGVWAHVPTFSDQSGKSLVLVFLVVVRIGAHKARGGGLVGGVVVVDCTLTGKEQGCPERQESGALTASGARHMDMGPVYCTKSSLCW